MFVKVINLVTHPISETEGDDANKPLNEKDDKDFGWVIPLQLSEVNQSGENSQTQRIVHRPCSIQLE